MTFAEFEEKYKFNIDMNYSSDMQLDLNVNYKRIIHEGYKNKDFYELLRRAKNKV